MSIYTKLFELQKKLKPIKKDATNPFFKSRYFDINSLIDSITGPLEAVGLVVLQPLTSLNGKPALRTIIADPETGENINEAIELPELTGADAAQKMGSAITYYRRYSLQSLLRLQAEDDDGNFASGRDAKTEPKAWPKPIPAAIKKDIYPGRKVEQPKTLKDELNELPFD